MDELIEALNIFLRYANLRNPTHCEHDELWIAGIDPGEISDEDKATLDELGFFINDEGAFMSFRFGSA